MFPDYLSVSYDYDQTEKTYSTLADNLDAFHLTCTTELNIERILRSTIIRKAAGIGDLLGHLLKDGL